jgi:hypothetical protein
MLIVLYFIFVLKNDKYLETEGVFSMTCNNNSFFSSIQVNCSANNSIVKFDLISIFLISFIVRVGTSNLHLLVPYQYKNHHKSYLESSFILPIVCLMFLSLTYTPYAGSLSCQQPRESMDKHAKITEGCIDNSRSININNIITLKG